MTERNDDQGDALTVAREALRVAQEAVRQAEEALRLAGAGSSDSSTAAPPVPETPCARVVEELTVKRINVVEDDGRLRMIIGNSTHGSTAPMRGELRRHPGRYPCAGLLFVNDEGTECGGLQFAGRSGEGDSGASQTGYLSFDDFEQNESFRLGLSQQGGVSQRFIEFVDQPSWSLVDFVDDYEAAGDDEAARDRVSRQYVGDPRAARRSRLLLTRDDAGAARIVLRDGQGRDRLRLIAPAEGDPVVEVVDEHGRCRSLV
ncbi:hypothetical protein [Mobilicoccus massiliensis]|uniref:hypothetical protein n=1 Tax=Mobilicoccus massiliensis TaxID=1522310 RepID=UPI0006942574|nr:hypothetical protein [Mobilicoccus massiliensis]